MAIPFSIWDVNEKRGHYVRKVVLPSLPEQQAIAAVLSDMDAEVMTSVQNEVAAMASRSRREGISR